MTEISKIILEEYQVRKTKKQKLRFIEFMKSHYPSLVVEEGGLVHNRNHVVGDVDKAKVIFSAHYDTCARLPFPNIIMPKNIFLSLLYSVLICLPFLAVMFLVRWLLGFLTDDPFITHYCGFLVSFLTMVFVLFLGVPNRHTANDNTSGVVTLCELMKTLTLDEREKCAFVFFDNEENGLLGSSFFRKSHKKQMDVKLLINFDCVGDGDNILIVMSKFAHERYGEIVSDKLCAKESKRVWVEKSSKAYYPSDQAGFPFGVGVAALKGKKASTLYLNRIHTDKDTVCDERNIRFVTEGFADLLRLL